MASYRVLCNYLTALPDPQRRIMWAKNTDALQPLLDSVVDPYQTVVFHDELNVANEDGVEFVKVATGSNPLFDRWWNILHWLEENPVDWVWCVDSTDVIMLRRPNMSPGVLYVGSQPRTLDVGWLQKHHPSARSLIVEHPDWPLLNCGIVGGDWATVTSFLHLFTSLFDERDRTEMGSFNRAVWTGWGDRIVTGPWIHTLFRSESDNGQAWWQHK